MQPAYSKVSCKHMQVIENWKINKKLIIPKIILLFSFVFLPLKWTDFRIIIYLKQKKPTEQIDIIVSLNLNWWSIFSFYRAIKPKNVPRNSNHPVIIFLAIINRRNNAHKHLTKAKKLKNLNRWVKDFQEPIKTQRKVWSEKREKGKMGD